MKYGEILAVQFVHRAGTYSAFLFENPQSRGYYQENGDGVRRPFLRAPFAFDRRITSRFSHSRYHPILKIRRPHLGVDYGAPRGTPVLASADGTVISAGRKGGFGNLVRVRHPNGYVTGYAHLSRMDVRRGQRVKQGERIGRVGTTGLSTAPHLDYRVPETEAVSILILQNWQLYPRTRESRRNISTSSFYFVMGSWRGWHPFQKLSPPSAVLPEPTNNQESIPFLFVTKRGSGEPSG